MGWGSTYFLDPYWQKNQIETDYREKHLEYRIGSNFALKNYIKSLHKKIKNAETKNRHIVIAAGASQILLGLMAVLAKRGHKTAYAKPPYFSRFPKLANIGKLKWSKKRHKKTVTIVTNPNNPDFSTSDCSDAKILDLCYNWPQYTSKVTYYDHPIMVFSLSKATGHASTRIGWAILEDETLAKELEDYIEISTGGLSIDSQIRAEEIILDQLQRSDTVFKHGRRTLKYRWKILSILSANKNFPLQIFNNSGMFIWAKVKNPRKNNPIIDKNIAHLKGSAMGSTNVFIRLNIGCTETDFRDFLALMRNMIDSQAKK